MLLRGGTGMGKTRPGRPVPSGRVRAAALVLATHTNENEYNAFVNNKKNEALKDRIILIMPTPLQNQVPGLQD